MQDVCKTWRTLIDELLNDPSFIDIHTRRFLSLSPSLPTASFSFLAREKCVKRSQNDKLLVGSCNGLVCFIITNSSGLQDFNVYIGNPVTKKHVTLPPQFHPSPYRKQQLPWLTASFVVATGFGYHPCTKEYKFVRITKSYFPPGHDRMYVSVYTLGSGKWSIKEVEEDSFNLNCNARPIAGLLFNGALYWSQTKYDEKIISFDLEKEEFRRVPSPPHVSHENTDEIAVLGECFCVIRTIKNGPKDIWIMSKLQGEKDYTWTKKFSTQAAMVNDIKPFAIEKRFSWSYDYMKFASDGPKTASCQLNHLINSNTMINSQMVDYLFEKLVVSYMSSRFEVIPYIKSLVSLRALGESADVAARRERKRKREGHKYIRLEDWLESISCRRRRQRQTSDVN